MEKFVETSNTKFNNNFDFSQTVYKNTFTSVTIRCKKHDEIINICPSRHIRQQFGGCKFCRYGTNKNIILTDGEIISNVNLKGYELLYRITDFSRCFSTRTNRELKTHKLSGYKYIDLFDINKTRYTISIHELVYRTFKKDYDENKVIDHINGDRFNNKIDNLRCVTQTENVNNAYRNNKNMYQGDVIQGIDINGQIIEFSNVNEAVKFLKLSNGSSIYRCLKGKIKTVGGYKWNYKYDSILEKKLFCVTDFSQYTCITEINGMNFSKYYIHKDGIIVNKDTKKKLNLNHADANGYITLHLYHETNKKK